MKNEYAKFIEKYPQIANAELEQLCNIFKNEVDGVALSQVKPGSKSRELIYELPHGFELYAVYMGKLSGDFRLDILYKGSRVKSIANIKDRHIFYRIENIKIAIEYTLEKRKSDVDFYLPLYKRLTDIMKDILENCEVKNSLSERYDEQNRVLSLVENEDLILKGVVKKTQPYINYSYSYSDKTYYEINEDLLSDILFKELNKFISFLSLVGEVEAEESRIKYAQRQIDNSINNFL